MPGRPELEPVPVELPLLGALDEGLPLGGGEPEDRAVRVLAVPDEDVALVDRDVDAVVIRALRALVPGGLQAVAVGEAGRRVDPRQRVVAYRPHQMW